jgi:16S rRNA G966 N2-methylase RsmD
VTPKATISGISTIRSLASNSYWWARSLIERFSLTKLCQKWKGYRFDRRYGIETGKVVAVSDMGVERKDTLHATCYRPTSVGFLRFVLEKNSERFEDFVFVDLGSGKGRVLIEAASFPFKRIIGVELSTRLHLAAKESVSRFEAKEKTKSRIELQCKSATEFEPPTENVIFYLYNPFDAEILGHVVRQIQISLRKRHRKMLLIYLNPRWFDVIEDSNLFVLLDVGQYGPDDYRVYRTEENRSTAAKGNLM